MQPLSRSSAVGSAPRSGRGGRAFESPLLDEKGWSEWPSFLSRGTPTPAFLSRCARTIIAAQFTSRLFSTKKDGQNGHPFCFVCIVCGSEILIRQRRLSQLHGQCALAAEGDYSSRQCSKHEQEPSAVGKIAFHTRVIFVATGTRRSLADGRSSTAGTKRIKVACGGRNISRSFGIGRNSLPAVGSCTI